MIAPLLNHLWQSTLFAGVAGLLALLLRRNSAAIRHGLWMAASIKFLAPFSLLILLGGELPPRKAPDLAASRFEVVEQLREPAAMLASPARLLPQRSPGDYTAVWFGIWFCGFAANVWAWRRGWRQMRAIQRSASPLPLNLPVPALSTSARLEPGVFGIFRPVLLLPEGLSECLTAAQFDAIVAHELCHVRRRDNLSSAIHMLVESVFWFHPAVWWIRAQLLEEREQACDEAVLRMGSDPREYAEGIVKACEFYLQSPSVCVSGVTGSNLKRRVETIMRNRTADRLNFAKKLLLSIAGLLMVAMPLTVGALNGSQEPAKPVPEPAATAALPAFEVASVKPSTPDGVLKVDFAPGGKLFITHATLRFLIKIAYDIGDDQLAGGPGWVGSRRFDLAATPERPLGGDPKNMAPDQILIFHKPVRLRLQRLLAERFQLELRKESAPMPVFALVVARGGPRKLAPAKNSGDLQSKLKYGNGVLDAVGVDMTTLSKFLSEGQTGRPVVDRTGLQGKYNFHLEWTPDTISNSPSADPAASPQLAGDGLSIFAALQQQLGLKLEARTSPADRLMVVRAEPPSAN